VWRFVVSDSPKKSRKSAHLIGLAIRPKALISVIPIYFKKVKAADFSAALDVTIKEIFVGRAYSRISL